jgi:hypothetical protein
MLFRINQYSVHVKYDCLDLTAPHLLQPLFFIVCFFIYPCATLHLHGIQNLLLRHLLILLNQV